MYNKKVMVYGTAGPACGNYETLRDMFLEGMDGIRLNLSHTTLEESADVIDACHKAANACGIKPEILIDLQGPELRIGKLQQPARLTDGDLVDMEELSFPKIVQEKLEDITEKQDVLLDDGKILLRTEKKISCKDIKFRVIRGGILTSRKSIALPGCCFPTPAMTAADLDNIRNAHTFGVTAVMQPFVRSKDDLIEVRNVLDREGCKSIRIYAKIENSEGIGNLNDLIPYCDEIVIARGDLGNSMNLWELPAAQKKISSICRNAGKDFMVVTQMLDSMTSRQVPTRAEVSDIFNAVLDGAASVMVTGETASGKYPVLVIRYLSKTVREAEAYVINKFR